MPRMHRVPSWASSLLLIAVGGPLGEPALELPAVVGLKRMSFRVHTGDKGYLDEEGNLHVTGRVQDTFKTSKGKYVAPVPIEAKFSRSVLVEQQCLYGFGLTQPIMLCSLSETARQQKGYSCR